MRMWQQLPPQDVAKLAAISKLRRCAKGEILYYEEDAIESIYLLGEGVVKIYKVDRFDNEIFLYTIKPGEFITEFSLLHPISCFSNAECLEDSQVIEFSLSALRELCRRESTILLVILEGLFSKTTKLQCVINREIIFDGTAKVAHMLDLSLDEFNGVKKQEVAYRLNIQPETLSRILKKLHKDGVIATDHDGNLQIIDQEKLMAIYR